MASARGCHVAALHAAAASPSCQAISKPMRKRWIVRRNSIKLETPRTPQVIQDRGSSFEIEHGQMKSTHRKLLFVCGVVVEVVVVVPREAH